MGEWTMDRDGETRLYGEQNNGAGVFWDGPEDKWCVNISYSSGAIDAYNKFESEGEAKKFAEDTLRHLKARDEKPSV